MKHKQKQFGKERVYSIYSFISQFMVEGSQGKSLNNPGTRRQELMQLSWREAAYWLVPKMNSGLVILRFISYVALSLKCNS